MATHPFFLAGYIYPLKDPQRYDDDYGRGYYFAAIDAGATPLSCRIHDVWIVNEFGERHPGYNISPVPIRIDDVHMEQGWRLEAILPASPTEPQTGQ
jgi:hypothetical protein